MKLLKKLWYLIKKAWNHKPREIVRHHDNRSGSYYRIASDNLRQTRKDRYGL